MQTLLIHPKNKEYCISEKGLDDFAFQEGWRMGFCDYHINKIHILDLEEKGFSLTDSPSQDFSSHS